MSNSIYVFLHSSTFLGSSPPILWLASICWVKDAILWVVHFSRRSFTSIYYILSCAFYGNARMKLLDQFRVVRTVAGCLVLTQFSYSFLIFLIISIFPQMNITYIIFLIYNLKISKELDIFINLGFWGFGVLESFAELEFDFD